MAADLDLAIVKKTQSSLGKFVKRPALTEKLLRKPPFRFLHDIVHVIIVETHLLEGLYGADELNSDNVKDRDSKMAFLQKLVDVVKLLTGKELKVRPSKIVAGLEPERTNELLQALGFALEQQLNSADIVRQYLQGKGTVQGPSDKEVAPVQTNGTTEEKPPPVAVNSKKEKSKDKPREEREKGRQTVVEKEKPKDEKKGKDRGSKSKEKEVVRNGVVRGTVTVSKSEKPKPGRTQDAKSVAEKKKTEKIVSKTKEKEKTLKRVESIAEEPTVPAPEPPTQNGSSALSSIDHGDAEEMNGRIPEHEDQHVVELEELEKRKANSSRRSSLKKQNSLTPSENNVLSDMNQFNGLELPPPTLSRQNSSGVLGEAVERRGSDPPEPMVNGEPERATLKTPLNRQQSIENVMRPRTTLRPPSVRPPSARPGAPRRKEKNVEVILQPNETQKLGDINVKMEVFNNELLDDDGENLIVIEDATGVEDAYGIARPPEEIEPKEPEEQGHLVQQILETQKEFSSHAATDVDSVRKAENEWTTGQRQSSAKQMESMRESIQKLTRSVNPLGKLMDFIQEDIDAMERELTGWQQLYSQAALELNKERTATESAIEPLKHQLTQIDTSIREYRDMIDATRANILQNEQKIERLYMTEI